MGRFCGNGTRCAARFAVLKGLAPENLIVKTGWGDVVSRVEATTVTLRLPEPVAMGRAVSSLDATGTLEREAYALTVGVPNVVALRRDGRRRRDARLRAVRAGPEAPPRPARGRERGRRRGARPVAAPHADLGARRRGRDARVRLGQRRDGRHGRGARRVQAAGRRSRRARAQSSRSASGFEGEVARDITLAGRRPRRLRGNAGSGGMGGGMRIVRFETGRAPPRGGSRRGSRSRRSRGRRGSRAGRTRTGAPAGGGRARLLAAAAPSKILCIGRNYARARRRARPRGPEGAPRLLQAALLA